MAAFPGSSNLWPAKRPSHEALERFALIGWWEWPPGATQEHGPFRAFLSSGSIMVSDPAKSLCYIGERPSNHLLRPCCWFKRIDRGEPCGDRAGPKRIRDHGYRARGALVEPSSFAERRCLHYASHEGLLSSWHVSTKGSAPCTLLARRLRRRDRRPLVQIRHRLAHMR